MKQPRRHHYSFAHKALPDLFFQNPSGFIDSLCLRKTDLLRFLWRRLGELEIEAESDRISTDALGCRINEFEKNTTVVLIILPRPEGITEAHFVAMVYRPPAWKLLKKQKEIARYITLEFNRYQDDTPKTVLGEWTDSGMHLNFGDGPEPTLIAFLEVVRVHTGC